MDGDTRGISSSSSSNSNSNSNSDDDDDGSSNNRLDIEIDVDKDPIVRGNTQSFTVKVSDRDTGDSIEDSKVGASVKYAGPHTEHFDPQTTDNSGSATFSWLIGGGSDPGTFTITVEVSNNGYASNSETRSFEVITKADEIPSILQSNEICDDGKDNDDDGLVDAEDPDCQSSIDPCIENPELPECPTIDPCEDNPDLPECQPVDPCEENPDSEECGSDEPEPNPDPEPEPEDNNVEDNQAEDEDEEDDEEED